MGDQEIRRLRQPGRQVVPDVIGIRQSLERIEDAQHFLREYLGRGIGQDVGHRSAGQVAARDGQVQATIKQVTQQIKHFGLV